MLFMEQFCSHLYQLHTRIIPSFSPWHPFHCRSTINCRFLDARTVSLFKTSEKSGNWVTPAPHPQRNSCITIFKQLDTLIFQCRFTLSGGPIKPKLKIFFSHEAFSKWAEMPIVFLQPSQQHSGQDSRWDQTGWWHSVTTHLGKCPKGRLSPWKSGVASFFCPGSTHKIAGEGRN